VVAATHVDLSACTGALSCAEGKGRGRRSEGSPRGHDSGECRDAKNGAGGRHYYLCICASVHEPMRPYGTSVCGRKLLAYES
jgi:hypothetical protein